MQVPVADDYRGPLRGAGRLCESRRTCQSHSCRLFRRHERTADVVSILLTASPATVGTVTYKRAGTDQRQTCRITFFQRLSLFVIAYCTEWVISASRQTRLQVTAGRNHSRTRPAHFASRVSNGLTHCSHQIPPAAAAAARLQPGSAIVAQCGESAPATPSSGHMTEEVSRSRQRHHQHMLDRIASALMLTLLLSTLQQCTAANDFFTNALSDTAATASPFANQKYLTLVFPLKPLSRPPTPPPAYKEYPNNQWSWLGGAGYFLITKSDYGPLGALTEAWYLPGRYHPRCSGKKDVYYSAQRLWVNMEISKQIGRQVWGFPKEMATFQWGPQSVALNDSSGRTIFSARFSDQLNKPSPTWLNNLAKSGLDTIQWPIQDKSSKTSSLLELQLSGDAQSRVDAVIAASILPKPLITVSSSASIAANGTLTPNTQHLTFNGSTPGAIVPAPGYQELRLLRVTRIEINSEAFTGRVGKEVQLARGLEIGFIKGTPGSLDNPVQYGC